MKLQPQELTLLMDKDMIVNVRRAFVEATKQAEKDGEELEGTYASIAASDFVELLKSSNVIPPDVCDKITEYIDVNDDGDIDFDEFINFVLAAESNLEYSKQQGMERFSLSTMQELGDTKKYSKESFYTLSYTGNPLSMVVGGGSSGEVHLYNSMSFRLLGKFPYESKAMTIRNNLMTGIIKQDQPVLKARLKGEARGGKNILDKVELTSSCILPHTPSMLVMGAADASFAVFDISSPSRLEGAVGRVNSLSSPPTSMIAVRNKLKHYGEHTDNDGSSGADSEDGLGESAVVSEGRSRVGVTTSSHHHEEHSTGTTKDPVQTIYIGCSDGRLYWLPLDSNFGTSSDKGARKKNMKIFEQSVLRAGGKKRL